MNDRWLLHKFDIATKNVNEYKKHIVRAIHQDQAKTAVMDKLSVDEALIIFDYAMKFLPQKYREAQSDFFAKKGLKPLSVHYITTLESNYRFVVACDGLLVEKR